MEKLIDKVRYPNEFDIDVMICHIKFNDEMTKLISRSGFEDTFRTLFLAKIKIIINLGEKKSLQSKTCETLRKTFILSMLFKNSINVRILFQYIEHAGKRKIILLRPFIEKTKGSQKLQSNGNYSKNIKIAEERYSFVEEYISKNGTK